MKSQVIIHDSHQEFFRSPFGAVCCNDTISLRLKVQLPFVADAVTARLWLEGCGEKKVVMTAGEPDGEGAVFFHCCLNAAAVPGLMWYYFIISSGEACYYYGNSQERLGGEGELYDAAPPAYQVTVYKAEAITPAWFKHSIMYQIFPDRFYRGTEQVLHPKRGSVLHSHWDNHPYYIRDAKTQRIVAYDFFGGNLQGVMDKLPYLQELGVGVIYFNPVFASVSNHRYDTGDYKQVDSMLGDEDTFRRLCSSAKAAGIGIVLDGVFSHTGSDSVYFNRYGTYKELGAYQSKQSPYYSWYRFKEYPDSYEAWWGIDNLPNVEETEPSYIDFIINHEDSVIRHWLKMGIKGWRLDVADELPDEFIQGIRRVMKEEDPDSVLIGEVWEDASNKESYGQLRRYLQGDELDSVMNYPFRSITLDFMLGRSNAWQVHRLFMSLAENYPAHNFYALMNLLGSHDVPRILSILGEADFAELSPAEQAVYRLPPQQRQLAVKRLKLLTVWQMTFPGVPSIYYGDEAGAEGLNDPYNRGTYPWGQEDQEILDWYKRLTALRNRHAALRTGRWISLPAGDEVYAYVRHIGQGTDVFGDKAADDSAVILLNRSAQSAMVTLYVRPWCHGRLQDALAVEQEYTVEAGQVTVELAPYEGKVLLQVHQDAFKRQAGILLHPTSLPSRYGIGDLGKEAYDFVDFLHASGQTLWQVLPLNSTGPSHSPYQCLSAFAGNHWLISLRNLLNSELLQEGDLIYNNEFTITQTDFDKALAFKQKKLRKAFAAFGCRELPVEYEQFVADNAFWLQDYALFMALRSYFQELPWNSWPAGLATRQAAVLQEYEERLAEEIAYHKFLQFTFFSQWQQLKAYAAKCRIQIIGDIPIFVAHDSSDVWANQHLFDLDEDGTPLTVTGVPPDYFSETGQLWGNPQYRWTVMEKDDYAWWRQRLEVLSRCVDIVRVDHFRAFEAFWEIPAEAETAITGQWVKGPGERFFTTVQRHLGQLPIMVEDLGLITPEVDDLKHRFYFPGIKVLQFALEYPECGKAARFGCERNCVLYTGTHDNETLAGWYENLQKLYPQRSAAVDAYVADVLGEHGPPQVHWRLIECMYAANANTLIIPLQDILGLGNEARMNLPGIPEGNWGWRCRKDSFTVDCSNRLRELVKKYQR